MIRRAFTLFLGIAAVLPSFSQARADDFEKAAEDYHYDNRWALVIGINYEGSPAVDRKFIKPLKTAEADARAVADVLKTDYGFTVTTLIGKEATLGSIRAKLGTGFLGKENQVKDKDCALIYYAGHGDRRDSAQKGESIGLLYPYDVNFDEGKVDKDSCFWLSELREKLRVGCFAKHKLLILDSCYSGQVFGADTRAALDSTPGINARAFHDKVFWGLASARGDQEAQDGKDHSPFAEALLGILSAAEGTPISGSRLVASMETRLSDQLRGKNQDALGLRLDGTTGDFYLFPKGPVVQKPSADLLLSMPGLYGRWWFQELPWLVPGLREDLVRLGEPIDFYSPKPANRNGAGPPRSPRLSDDVKEIYKAAHSRFGAMVEVKRFPVPGYVLLLQSLSNRAADQAGDKLQLAKASAALEAYAKDHPTGAVFHSSAALKHRMGLGAEAKELYEKAILAYSTKPPAQAPAGAAGGVPGEVPPNEPLALCLDDYGRLRNDLLGEREFAQNNFQLARANTRNPFLRIESYCNEADALRNLHQFDEAEDCLKQALTIAPNSLEPNHPLLAYLHERYAWLFMERWELKKALVEFRMAKVLWTADKGDDPARAVFALDESHGIAMAQRFMGDLAMSQQTFNGLLGDTDKLINNHAQPAYQSILHLRRANSLERKADGELFAPKPRLEAAADGFEDALEDVSQAPLNMRPKQRAKILYKQAIALALLDRLTEASDALAKTDAEATEIKKDLDVLARVARAEVDLASKAKGPGPITTLRELVMDAVSDPEQKVDRDTLEILLFVTRQLLEVDRLEGKKSPNALKDADLTFKLSSVALERCRDGHDILPFLRDFLDVAIDVAILEKAKPRRLCEYFIKANLGQTATGLADDSPDLAFHFPENDGNGYAVLFDPDTSTGSVVALDLSLKQLRGMKSAGKTPLPRPLAEALAKVRGPVQVYWADDVLGLDDASFPFDRGAFDLRLPSEEQTKGRTRESREGRSGS